MAMVSGCFAGFPAHGRGNPWRNSVGTQWETRGKNAGRGLGRKRFPQKKVLSLVLCVAMLLSVMVMGTGAASFTDQDEFSDNYAEAAEVLTGMGIIQGYDDGSFLPQRNINRAQVATMIYRAATGDVTDSKISQFVGEDLFDDVNADDWFAGYVNYCGNAEYIKGFTPDTFGPYKQVTGYQVLAMILRAVGYDENNEYTGDQWTLRVAATSREQGLLDNLNPDTNLAEPATRELVAQLIFEAIQIDTVRYSPAAGAYRPSTTPASSLGEQVFDLDVNNSADEWGRPEVLWTYNTGDEETVIEIDPVATYTTAVNDCDVYEDTGISGDVAAYVNSGRWNDTYNISKTATKDNIGAQGQLVEVYDYTTVDGKDATRIVVIDTFLAQVTNVTEAKYDSNNHLAKDASLTLTVYDGANTSVTLTNGSTNYTYAVGDMLLINAYTNDKDEVISGDGQYVEIVSAAESFVGAQTKIHSNANYHTVNGTDYPDAVKFFRNDAGTNRTENFNWWMDQYDNLIGVTGITSNYAVLKDMIWVDGRPGHAEATLVYMDGTEATVTVNSIDGDSGKNFAAWENDVNNATPKLEDANVQGFTGTGDDAVAEVSSNSNYNGMYEGYAMYRVDTNSDGSVNLQGIEDYDADGSNEFTIGYRNDATLKIDGSAILVGGKAVTHVSNNTKFLVNDNGTYTAYTGTADLPEFNNRTVEVFYDTDSSISNYVYIKTFSSVFGDYVFATDDASYTTPDKNGVVTLEGVYVDGVLTEVTTTEQIAKELKTNMGKLYTAEWVDNEDTTSANYGHLKGITLVSENTDNDGKLNYLENTSKDNLTLTGNTLFIEDQNLSYNVTNADEVIYTDEAYEMTLAEAIEKGTYGIWVVGNKFNNTATVYVGEKLETENGISVTEVDGLDVAPLDTTTNTYKVTINDKNNDGKLNLPVDMLAGSQYAYYTVQASNGSYLKENGYFGGTEVRLTDPVAIQKVAAGDKFTVTVYTECGYNGTAALDKSDNCTDTSKSWTITVTGWDMITKGITSVQNYNGGIVMAEDVTGYDSVEDAVDARTPITLSAANEMNFIFDDDQFNFAGTTCTYQIFTDTASAKAGDPDSYLSMTGNCLLSTEVESGDIIMVSAKTTDGTPWFFAFQVK